MKLEKRMESYIVRIYREEKDDPRSFVGIVEEVDSEERRAFTNLQELWNILNSIKTRPAQPNNHVLFKTEKDKRMESRTKREIPCVFIHNKRKLDGCVLNCSQNGLSVQINERIDLPVGSLLRMQMKDSKARAEVRWAHQNSVPSRTVAGLAIVDGKCQLESAKKDIELVIRG